MPDLEKFSENSLKASSSRNQTLEGERSVEKEAPEQRGFRTGVDLRLSTIVTTNVNRFRGRRREEQSEKSQEIQIYQIYGKESMYAWEMHEHVICKIKNIMGSAQSKLIITQTYSTHLNACQYCYNANVMQFMRF